MSSTPDSASVDEKVSVASHLLNLPSMATEAFTKNLTSLSSGVTVKTGTWARLTDGSMVDTNRHKTANRMEFPLTGVSFLLAKTTPIVRLFRRLGTCEKTFIWSYPQRSLLRSLQQSAGT